MEQTNQTAETTWGIALEIWWWIIWRSVLGALAGGFVVGFIIGFVLAIAGIHPSGISVVSGLLGGIVGIVINVFFFKKVIGKKFQGFTLTLSKTE